MKLIYKGVFKDEEQLPKGVLPPNAVKFREPETPEKLTLASLGFLLPVLLLIGIITFAAVMIHGNANHIGISRYSFIIGLLLSLLTYIPHEFLHAICFGKDSEVELYIAPKMAALFVVSTSPITKARFIFLSLLPNLLFGWAPLILWAILPYSEAYSGVLYIFSILGVLSGCGDYVNVFNAFRQMPKGSMQQLSGFHSYWFMP